MHDAPDRGTEPLPIVVSANEDQSGAVARLVFGTLAVLGLLGAVALPVHDRLVGTPGQWPPGAYAAAAMVGGFAGFVAVLLWVTALPVSWTVDAGGITRDGPRGRHDLRWGDVWRVLPKANGYEFYGRSGLTVRLPWEAVPKGRRAAVCAGVEAILREHFHVPPPHPIGTGGAMAHMSVLVALLYGPPVASWYILGNLVSNWPRTILGWAWVRHLFDWSPDAARAVLSVVFIGPGLAYLMLGAWLLRRRTVRETQILPKRPVPT